MRRALLAAAAVAPMLALMGGAAWADCPASGAGTDGSDISLTCTVTPKTDAAGLVLNSNNNVTVEGGVSISNTNVNNTVGIQGLGGFTGNITGSGTITLLSSYSASLEGTTGLAGGAFTTGQDRVGIQVIGPGVFNGSITNTTSGSIEIQGNSVAGSPVGNISAGIDIETGVTGDVVNDGSVNVIGNQTIGVAINGAIGGNVTMAGTLGVTGVGAVGLETSAPIAGQLVISSTITTTAYRSTVAPTVNLNLLGADQVEQGGSAVIVGGSVAGGIIVNAAITTGTGTAAVSTAAAAVSEFGAAPAMVIGAPGQAITIGPNVSDPGQAGLVIGGSVSASGVYDPKTTPSLTAPVPATGILIGNGGSVALSGGIHVTGSVVASSLDASATAISIGGGVTGSSIVNDGTISAGITGETPQTVLGIAIAPTASIGSIVNNGVIEAAITDSTDTSGYAGAIIDHSGTVTSITNTGAIDAALTSLDITQTITGARVAIDVSHATNGVSIVQSQSFQFGGQNPAQITGTVTNGVLNVVSLASGSGELLVGETISGPGIAAGTTITTDGTGIGGVGTYGLSTLPTVSQETITASGPPPAITGDILFGGGTQAQPNVLDIEAGAVTGAVTEVADSSTTAPASTNRFLEITVNNGALDITQAQAHQVTSLNVTSTGSLTAEVDPSFAIGAGNPTPVFDTTVHPGQSGSSGTATFADGAQIGLTLDTLQTAPSAKYIFVQTAGGGALQVGNLDGVTLSDAPFLYTAATSSDANDLYVTVTLKTPQQLGLNTSGAAAFDAVLAALQKNSAIGAAIITPTTQYAFATLYNQMIPDQGIGTFDALEAATQKISNLTEQTPDSGSRIAGTSAWLQEVDTTVKRNDGSTIGETDKVFGLVGGYEHMGAAGGALGLTVAYLNIGDEGVYEPIGGGLVTNLAEVGAYYRRAWGGLRLSVRGAGGYAWFDETRLFVTTGVSEESRGQWGGYFGDAHAGLEYEVRLGRFYMRPEVSFDYLYLNEDAHSETGAGPGFDLTVNQQNSERGTAAALLTVGAQYGHDIWFRPEVFAGYREVAFGQIASTTATFLGGSPFTLEPGDQNGGWLVAGFSLKAGTPLSYVAVEGEADLRQNEQRYDVYLSGRAMF